MVREQGGWTSCSYTFLCQLIRQLLVSPGFVLHFLGFLVIIDGQLFQGLQHLLHFILGRLILDLQPGQLLLDLLVIPPRRGQKLGRNITAALSDPKNSSKNNKEKEKSRQGEGEKKWAQIVRAGGEKSWKQHQLQHKCIWQKHKKIKKTLNINNKKNLHQILLWPKTEAQKLIFNSSRAPKTFPALNPALQLRPEKSLKSKRFQQGLRAWNWAEEKGSEAASNTSWLYRNTLISKPEVITLSYHLKDDAEGRLAAPVCWGEILISEKNHWLHTHFIVSVSKLIKFII